MSILSNYSDQEFEQIVQQSHNYKECINILGYNSYSGKIVNLVKNRIQQLGLSTEHFISTTPIKRTEENVFIEDSTVDQKTLRTWYKKGNYTPYKCSICGQEPFWNNQPLTLILDHINGHNKDDRLENLRWVCPNCNYQLDTTNGKNKQHKEHQLNYCIDCGTPISKVSTRCVECYNKYLRRNADFVEQINREDLKQLIRTTPFTKIGEQFGVSDNAVRKWCDKYHLPRKSSEIKAISDQDWEKI